MNFSNRKDIDYVVGDLVYYTGTILTGDRPPARVQDNSKRVGIVVKVSDTAFHTYAVYWLKDELVSNHVANHLELVYNV